MLTSNRPLHVCLDASVMMYVQNDNRYGGLTVAVLAITTIIFRCDVIVLAAPLLLAMLISGWSSLTRVMQWGLLTSVIAIITTIIVDSYFWQRYTWPYMWPEWHVILFNVVANKSSNYGTEPWHWYFSNALPRALLVSLPFIVMAIEMMIRRLLCTRATTTTTRTAVETQLITMMLVPAVIFVALYSWLPHKELRFLFPSLPLFNASAAIAIAAALTPTANTVNENDTSGSNKKDEDMSSTPTPSTQASTDNLRRRTTTTSSTSTSSASPSDDKTSTTTPSSTSTPSQRPRQSRCCVCIPCSVVVATWLLLCGMVAIVFLYISSCNYPGGYALEQFHNNITITATTSSATNDNSKTDVSPSPLPWVHIDNWPAMTGASRWGEQRHRFRYSRHSLLSNPMMTHNRSCVDDKDIVKHRISLILQYMHCNLNG
jgi:hypothetical protein